MSTLLIQAGGAGLGFLVGGVEGAKWGWQLGGILGAAVQPPEELPPTFGPRLGDLKVQTSTYGTVIPRVYGTARIAGNVIWSTSIEETPNTTTVSSGGKGGGGSEQQQTTYSYSASFAVALCEGQIDAIRKIWANGKLVYSVSGSASANTLLGSLTNMTVYTGSESQTADSLMESYLGSGNVPGYRGVAYVVFEDLQLAEFGNRVPNMEFEVVMDADTYTTSGETSIYDAGAFTASTYVVHGRDANMVWANNSSSSWIGVALSNDNQATSATTSFRYPLWVDGTGTLHAWDFNGGLPNLTHVTIDNDGNVVTETFTGTSFLPHWVTSGLAPAAVDGAGNGWVAGNSSANIFYVDTAANDVQQLANPFSSIRPMINGGDIPGRMYCWSPANTGTRGWGYYNTVTQEFTTLQTYSSGTGKVGLVDADGYIYIGSPDDTTTLRKYTRDGVLSASVTLTSNSDFRNMALDELGYLYVYGLVGAQNRIFKIDLSTFTVSGTVDVASQRALISGGASGGVAAMTFNIGANAFEIFGVYGYAVVEPNAVTLSSVVSDICQLSGLGSGDLDVTDLAAYSLDGYVVSTVSPVRGMLEPLQRVFFFDAVESDGQVKFVARGAASAVTVPQADLAAHDSGEPPAPAQITRSHNLDLPVEVDITYFARENEYQQVTQSSRRQVGNSRMKFAMPLPIVMTDAVARGTADKTLYALWQERDRIEFQTSREYLPYEPSDVMTVTIGDASYRVRIERKEEGGNGVMKWEGVIEDSSVYTQSANGGSIIAPNETVPLYAQTVVEFLDVPLLRDVDDDPGFYVAAAGATTTWRGYQLYQSTDGGTSYSALANGTAIAAVAVGEAITELADCSRPGMFDEGGSVTVAITGGATLSSASRSDVLNGANAAVLGDEVFQFRTATLISSGIYTLTGLLRGRLGTEWAMSTHAVGDRFALLDSNLRTIVQDWPKVGASLYYKPVSFGRTLAATTAETFTNTAIRKKPLAPVHLKAGRDGNGGWVIEWKRRTRFDAPWRDGVDAPLGEASEAYEIDVMNGATVVRTITATTTSASYTAAQEATDFGSPTPASLTINVYQVSSAYGRGRAATGTFS